MDLTIETFRQYRFSFRRARMLLNAIKDYPQPTNENERVLTQYAVEGYKSILSELLFEQQLYSLTRKRNMEKMLCK